MCVGVCACLYCIYIHIKQFITRNQLTCCGGWEAPKSAMAKLETQQNWQCGSGPKPDKVETHEKPVFQFEFKDRKNSVSQLKGSQVAGSSPYSWKGQTFVLFRLLTDWIRFTHIKKGNCFTQFTDPNINLVQKLRHIQNVWPNVGTLWHITVTLPKKYALSCNYAHQLSSKLWGLSHTRQRLKH